jgi:hypothetical protein
MKAIIQEYGWGGGYTVEPLYAYTLNYNFFTSSSLAPFQGYKGLTV